MSLFHSHVYFLNDHTDEPAALGLALQITADAKSPNLCYYLSAGGPPNALRSIWASLVKNTGASLRCSRWASDKFIRGQPPIKNTARGFKRTNANHLVAYSHLPELILLTDTKAALLIKETDATARQELRTASLPLAYARLEAWLLENSTLPVHPGWGEALWPLLSLADMLASKNPDPKEEKRALIPLTTFGDCLGAWLINDKFPWQPFVSGLLAGNQLTF